MINRKKKNQLLKNQKMRMLFKDLKNGKKSEMKNMMNGKKSKKN